MNTLFQEKQKFPLISTPDELKKALASRRGFFNVEESVYHAGPGLSQSVLKAYSKSPAHAKMMMAGLKVTTDAMKLGSACHAAVFEPERFRATFVAGPDVDRRTKAGKELWQAVLDANPGRSILAPDDVLTIDGILQSLRTHPYFSYVSDAIGYPELSYYWENFGVLCKARFDWITSVSIPLQEGQERIIFDLKTTEYGVSKEDCERTIRSLGYDIQAAWYLSAQPDAQFVFIFAEKKPPYAITFYQVGPKMRAAGMEKIDQLFSKHAECTAAGRWPCHDGGVILGD